MTQRCVSITTFRKKPQDKTVNQPLLKSYQDHRAKAETSSQCTYVRHTTESVGLTQYTLRRWKLIPAEPAKGRPQTNLGAFQSCDRYPH